MKRVIVIGGGAGGILASIKLKEELKDSIEVIILEKEDRIGKKILKTGNGKCNLSNLQMSLSEYQGSDSALIWKCLSRFGVQDTVHFFESLGLMIKEKNGYACVILAVTDILKNGSYVLFTTGIENELALGYNKEKFEQGTYVDGLVSRKKQIVSVIMNILNQ